MLLFVATYYHIASGLISATLVSDRLVTPFLQRLNIHSSGILKETGPAYAYIYFLKIKQSLVHVSLIACSNKAIGLSHT